MMNKKIKLFSMSALIALLGASFLSSCASSAKNAPIDNHEFAAITPNDDTYTINFYADHSGSATSLLKTYQLGLGATPTYDGATPTPTNPQPGYTYTFKEWSPVVCKVTGNANYYANYTLAAKQYDVTFKVDGQGDVVKQYHYGDIPSYGSIPPTKDGYIFTGWNPAISPVADTTDPIIYTAKFDKITDEDFTVTLNSPGCSFIAPNGQEMTGNYTKHWDALPSKDDIHFTFKSSSAIRDLPYKVTATKGATAFTGFTYNSVTGQLNLTASPAAGENITFTCEAGNSTTNIDYDYSKVSGDINKEVGLSFPATNDGTIVDWGDGSVDETTNTTRTHIYDVSEVQQYKIKIYGTTNFSVYNNGLIAPGNVNFTDVRYFSNALTISDNQFRGCSNLTKINWTNAITSIGDNAFSNTNLSGKLILPRKLITLGAAFNNCSNLDSVIIPVTVSSIAGEPFASSAATKLFCELEEKPATGWSDNWSSDCAVYWGYKNDANASDYRYVLESVNGKSFVTLIEYLGNDKDVILPSKITINNVDYPVVGIGGSAFANKSEVESVTIAVADGVTNYSIGRYAFRGCTNLKTLDLSDFEGVVNLDKTPFIDCSSLIEGQSVIASRFKYFDYLNNDSWKANDYYKFVKSPIPTITTTAEHCTVTYTLLNTYKVEATVTPKTGYAYPNNFKATVIDTGGSTGSTTYDIDSSTHKFSFDLAELTNVTVDLDIFKVDFNANGGQWADTDVIKTLYFSKGADISTPATNPTRNSSISIDYNFDSWMNLAETVIEDAMYYASWTPATRKYAITWKWKKVDGTQASQEMSVDYGATPTTPEGIPSNYHEEGSIYVYTFANIWSKPIRPVDGNETYEAQYLQGYQNYTVNWLDGDGATILDTETYQYGDTPTYKQAGEKTPTYIKEGHPCTWTGWANIKPLTSASSTVNITPTFDENVYYEFTGTNCFVGDVSYFVDVYEFNKSDVTYTVTADDGHYFAPIASKPDNYVIKFDGNVPADEKVTWTISQDGQSLTIKLNENMKYNVTLQVKAEETL